MRLGLLVLLGIVFLVPKASEGRNVKAYELRKRFLEQLRLSLTPHDYQTFKTYCVQTNCFQRMMTSSHADTGFLTIIGHRHITPTTTTTTTTTTRPTLTTSTTSTTTTIRPSANKRRRKRALLLEEDSGSGMTPSELLLDEKENEFDVEQMFQDDNKINGDSTDSNPKVTTWSIGYYGIFQLSDSHFCDSGYRWSRNVCNTSCTAFLDDDITDDVDCLFKSGYFWYLLRHVFYG